MIARSVPGISNPRTNRRPAKSGRYPASMHESAKAQISLVVMSGLDLRCRSTPIIEPTPVKNPENLKVFTRVPKSPMLPSEPCQQSKSKPTPSPTGPPRPSITNSPEKRPLTSPNPKGSPPSTKSASLLARPVPAKPSSSKPSAQNKAQNGTATKQSAATSKTSRPRSTCSQQSASTRSLSGLNPSRYSRPAREPG